MEYIRRYCGMVLTGAVRATDEVIKLCQYILDCFDNEDIYVREDKVAEYFGHQKYFLYKLLPWEEFLFATLLYIHQRNGASEMAELVYAGRSRSRQERIYIIRGF